MGHPNPDRGSQAGSLTTFQGSLQSSEAVAKTFNIKMNSRLYREKILAPDGNKTRWSLYIRVEWFSIFLEF